MVDVLNISVSINLKVDSLTIHFFWRCTTISELNINEQIRDKEIRLIGENGEQLGIMSAKEALKLAKEADLDLVKLLQLPNHLYVRLLIMANTDTRWQDVRKKLRKNRKQSILRK